jgi:hypothetical protein
MLYREGACEEAKICVSGSSRPASWLMWWCVAGAPGAVSACDCSPARIKQCSWSALNDGRDVGEIQVQPALGTPHTPGLDIKDCPLARGNQIWLSGKQIFMPACLTDNQIFHIFVHIYYIGQVKISLGQPVLAFYLPDGQVVQKVNVEPCTQPTNQSFFYNLLSLNNWCRVVLNHKQFPQTRPCYS